MIASMKKLCSLTICKPIYHVLIRLTFWSKNLEELTLKNDFRELVFKISIAQISDWFFYLLIENLHIFFKNFGWNTVSDIILDFAQVINISCVQVLLY
jgi:hypothetical protein